MFHTNLRTQDSAHIATSEPAPSTLHSALEQSGPSTQGRRCRCVGNTSSSVTWQIAPFAVCTFPIVGSCGVEGAAGAAMR